MRHTAEEASGQELTRFPRRGRQAPSSAALCLAVLVPALLLLPAACNGTDRSDEATGPKPNVLVIVVDTLRRDHLGSYGYERDTSPNIDALANDAVVYRRAVSQAPWTTASIGALMTSRYPTTLGIRDSRSVLSDDLELMAETLQRAGYLTKGIISHTFCSARWNFHQGFDQFDESSIAPHTQVTAPSVTAKALEFLESTPEEPFFLWLHYFDPHGLYLLHDEFDPTPQVEYDGVVNDNRGWVKLRRLLPELQEADIRQLLRAYDSEVGLTDVEIGRVLDRLQELDLLDNTLIVFTSDHGEQFGEHGDIGHDNTLYGELIDIPLIVRYPGGSPASIAGPVAMVDIYPTVLRAAGLPPGEGLVGRPLPRTPGEEGPEDRIIFSETSRRAELRAAVSRRYKLIMALPDRTYEFYDLQADPDELNNLAAAGGPEFDRHRQALDGWLREMAQAPRHDATLDLTDEEARRLRSLGYTGGD